MSSFLLIKSVNARLKIELFFLDRGLFRGARVADSLSLSFSSNFVQNVNVQKAKKTLCPPLAVEDQPVVEKASLSDRMS